MADEHTGGMLALVPDNPAALAVDGGEPAEELHLTLLYLGDDVTNWPAGAGDRLRQLVTASGPGLDPVDARIIGPALFNPDGGADGDRTPCLVLMVSDAPGLGALRTWANWTASTYDDYPDPPAQHEPYLPHVTVAVDPGDDTGVSAQVYTGPVRFGTLRLALAGNVLDMPLGNQEAPVITETKSGEVTFTPPQIVCEVAALLPGPVAQIVAEGKALNARGVDWVAENCGTVGVAWAGDMRDRAGEIEAKRAQAPETEVINVEVKRDMSGHERNGLRRTGHTLDGRTNRHPIQNSEDLKDEIDKFHDALPGDKSKLKGHLKSEATRLYAPQVIHDQIDALNPDHDGTEGKSLEDNIEIKLMSPDPRAEKLRNYWAHNPKAVAKWKPGAPGSFRRLRRHLAKYVHSPRVLNGLTANVFKQATGIYPGQRPHGGRSMNVGRVVGAKSLAPDALATAIAQATGADPIFPARLTVNCLALVAPGAELKSLSGGSLSAADAQRGTGDGDQVSVLDRQSQLDAARDASTPVAVHRSVRGDMDVVGSMGETEVKSAATEDGGAKFVLALGDQFEVVGSDAVAYAAQVVDMVELKAVGNGSDELLPNNAVDNARQVGFGHIDKPVSLFVLPASPQPVGRSLVNVAEKSLRPWQSGSGTVGQGHSASPSHVVHGAIAARAVLTVTPLDRTSPDGHEYKAIAQAANGYADEAELHEGVDDWGRVFVADWVDRFLADLDEADDTPEDADSAADETTSDLLATARHAAMGARMIADDGAAGADEPTGVAPAPAEAEPNLFDAPVTE